MNERIKQLAVAAAPVNSSIPSSEWNIPKEFIEKFAELIVKECVGSYSKIDNGNLHMGTDDYLEALHKTFRS